MFVQLTSTKADALLIPDEAIRMRVIPNSNSELDQVVKLKVKDGLQNKMYELLKNTKGVSDAREVIRENMPSLDKMVQSTLQQEQYNLGYQVNFGLNYFPKKEFKGVTYPEGNYESVVVTLGQGKGDNWWCVLFPPLCLVEAEESEEVEYKFFLSELIDKYL